MPMDLPIMFVDLGAVQSNFRALQRLVGPSVTVSAVIKSDAYGLGLQQIAHSLHEAGCSSFFVANLDEALCVRRSLPAPEVFVLSGIRLSDVPAYRSRRLTAVCNTLPEVVTAVSAAIPYALNLETGFGRLGLALDEVRSLAHSGLSMPILVMSHLACADDPFNPQNPLQRSRFVGMSEILGRTTPESLAASSGLLLGAAYHFDRVRVGSALFGLNTAAFNPALLPVMRLSARLLDVKLIPPGEGVGYMGTFRTGRATCLGIVGIGYKHGLAWLAANRLGADLAGFEVPIVGRISMEYCAVDLTDIPASMANVGVYLDFISPKHPAEQVASCVATVPQEIFLRAGASCSRIYRNCAGPIS